MDQTFSVISERYITSDGGFSFSPNTWTATKSGDIFIVAIMFWGSGNAEPSLSVKKGSETLTAIKSMNRNGPGQLRGGIYKTSVSVGDVITVTCGGSTSYEKYGLFAILQ